MTYNSSGIWRAYFAKNVEIENSFNTMILTFCLEHIRSNQLKRERQNHCNHIYMQDWRALKYSTLLYQTSVYVVQSWTNQKNTYKLWINLNICWRSLWQTFAPYLVKFLVWWVSFNLSATVSIFLDKFFKLQVIFIIIKFYRTFQAHKCSIDSVPDCISSEFFVVVMTVISQKQYT